MSEDSVNKTHHHEFTLSGTPMAYDDTVNVTFTATVNISGDTPVLRAVSSKDVNVSVSFYTISYDLQDGTLTAENQNPVSYDFTTPTFKLNNPAKKGYTFAGWTGTEVTNASTDVTIPKGSRGDREYTANWTLDTYTLSYTLNGGTVSTDNPTSYTVNSDDIVLTNPTKNGYTFVGWTGTGITEASTDVTIPKGSTGNREYTALWEIATYTLSYTLNGGTVSPANPTSYTINSDDITLKNPEQKGYTFTGWTGTGITGTSTDVTIPKGSTDNRSYTATWTPIEYSITYNLNNGTVSGNSSTYTIETNTFTLNNPSKNGYTFSGWTGTDLSGKTQTVTIEKGSTGDKEYTANFTPTVYTITYNLNGGTLAEANSASYTIESASITLNNPTRTAYTFAGWTGTDITAPTQTVTIPAHSTGNRTYTANWTPIQYTINLDLGGGEISGGDSISYNYETDTFKLNVPTKEGYDFVGWNLDGEDIISLDVEIPQGSAENLKYVANWKATIYVLSYTLNGGTVSPDNPVNYTIESEDLTLNNPTKTGYTFAGWTGTSVDAELSMDVTIAKGSTGDREYTANWELKIYTLSYNLNEGTVSQDNPVGYSIDSDDITLTNPTRMHYVFKGWSFDNEISLDVTIPKGSTGDREYIAVWEGVLYSISYDLQDGTLAEANPTSYTIETDDFTLNNPTREGYTFGGWTGTGLDAASMDVRITKGSTGSRRYVAVWTPIEYTISKL